MFVSLDSDMLSQGYSPRFSVIVVLPLQRRITLVCTNRARHTGIAASGANARLSMKTGTYTHIPSTINECFTRTRGGTGCRTTITKVAKHGSRVKEVWKKACCPQAQPWPINRMDDQPQATGRTNPGADGEGSKVEMNFSLSRGSKPPMWVPTKRLTGRVETTTNKRIQWIVFGPKMVAIRPNVGHKRFPQCGSSAREHCDRL
jgi:hypothetical protein